MAAWARAVDDDVTGIVAVMLENTGLALNLLRDLDEARRSGSERKVAKVRRRLDRVVAAIAATKVPPFSRTAALSSIMQISRLFAFA